MDSISGVEGGRNFPEYVDDDFWNGWTIVTGIYGRSFLESVDDSLRNMQPD